MRLNYVLEKTIHDQIQYAVDNGLGYGKSVDEIKKRFELSDRRFESVIQQTSGERWRVSMAVGYAYVRCILTQVYGERM